MTHLDSPDSPLGVSVGPNQPPEGVAGGGSVDRQPQFVGGRHTARHVQRRPGLCVLGYVLRRPEQAAHGRHVRRCAVRHGQQCID